MFPRNNFGLFPDTSLGAFPLWTSLVFPRSPFLSPFVNQRGQIASTALPHPTPSNLSLTTQSGDEPSVQSNVQLVPAATAFRNSFLNKEHFPRFSDLICKLEPCEGMLMLNVVLNGKTWTSVICIRQQGLKEGEEFVIPSSWMSFCRIDALDSNCDGRRILKTIPCGSEIVISKKEEPKASKSVTPCSDELIKEEETSSDSSGFSCPRCGKVFSYEYYRDKHLKYTRCVDQGDRKYPCTICTRSFEKRDRLRIHILHVHENHRPHSCSICGKSFSQSSSLNKHLRVHSGERPYKCSFCPKAFTASSILRTHIRQHSGEKPFKCAFCGKSFASHAAHDSHVRRTHTEMRSEE